MSLDGSRFLVLKVSSNVRGIALKEGVLNLALS